MTTTQYSAVLFDLDGTLLDTAPDFATALNLLLEVRGRPPLAADLIRAGVTNGSGGLITLAFGFRSEDAEYEPIRQEFLEIYYRHLSRETRPFPGVESLLEKLQGQDIPWGIVTNKPWLYTSAILRQIPFDVAPKAVVCPDHVQRNKPDPEPVLLACRQLDVATNETLYVGDHLRDIQAGVNAGAETAAAAYGYLHPEDDPHQWGADHVVNAFSDLENIIFQ